MYCAHRTAQADCSGVCRASLTPPIPHQSSSETFTLTFNSCLQTTLVLTFASCTSTVPCSGAGQFHEAEQYLSQAQWVVLNTPYPRPGIQSQLHRNLGLLALAKGQLSEARRHLAEDIYQSSTAFGPEAVQTAGGYFHLATAFAGEDRPDVVLSLHNEVHWCGGGRGRGRGRGSCAKQP